MRARSVVVLLAALTVTAACSGDDDSSEKKVLDLTDDGVGTCLLVDDTMPPEVAELPAVDDCSQDHTHEIYAVVEYQSDNPDDSADVFPGLEALNDFAQRECVREFEPYVLISAFDSELRFTWLTPTLSSWNDHDDRAILCVLNEQDGRTTNDSAKGSMR